jgi:hypothetical protein
MVDRRWLRTVHAERGNLEAATSSIGGLHHCQGLGGRITHREGTLVGCCSRLSSASSCWSNTSSSVKSTPSKQHSVQSMRAIALVGPSLSLLGFQMELLRTGVDAHHGIMAGGRALRLRYDVHMEAVVG